jgi:hypothetical protein
VSQVVVEALYPNLAPKHRLSQLPVEVLMANVNETVWVAIID